MIDDDDDKQCNVKGRYKEIERIRVLILVFWMKFKALKKKEKKESLRDIAEINRRNKDKRQEIQNQSKASRIIENNSKQRLQMLQHDMTNFAKLVELEVKKNQDLKNLIKSIESKLDKSKLNQQDHESDENLEELLKKKKKLQYDMQQITLKNNQSLATIGLLKEQVNAARSERVIYSSIFKNLEREIRVNSEEFKKLIIQKYQVELQRDQAISYYKKEEEARMKNFHHIPYPTQPILHLQDETQQEKTISKVPSIRFDLLKQQDHIKIQKKPFLKKKSMGLLNDQIEAYKNYVHKLQTEIGVDSIEQVIELSMGIDASNQNLFNRTNKLSEQIDEMNVVLAKIDAEIEEKKRANQQMKAIKLSRHDEEMNALKAHEQELCLCLNQEQRQYQESKAEMLKLGRILNIKSTDIDLKEDNMHVYLAEVEKRFYKEFEDVELMGGEVERKEQMRHSVSDLLISNEKSRDVDKIFSKAEFMSMGSEEIKRMMCSKKLIKRSRRQL